MMIVDGTHMSVCSLLPRHNNREKNEKYQGMTISTKRQNIKEEYKMLTDGYLQPTFNDWRVTTSSLN